MIFTPLSITLLVSVGLILLLLAIYVTFPPKPSEHKSIAQHNTLEYSDNVVAKALVRIPILKPVTRRIAEAFKRICPYDETALSYFVFNVMSRAAMFGGIGSAIIVAASLMTDGTITIYTYVCIAFFLYICFHEVLAAQTEKRRSQFVEDMAVYLANVKHSYSLTKSIPESVLRAAEGLVYEVRAHANQLYKILMDSNRANIIKEYMSNPNANRYIKLFLTQCYEASEFGDQLNDNGSSIFAENVETLRTEILKDDLYNKRKSWRYRGHMFVIVIPFFTFGLFRQWGMDFAGQLSSFYATTGHLVVIATFVVTVVIYRIFMRMRNYYAGQQRTRTLPYLKVIHKVADHLREGTGALSDKLRHILKTCDHVSLEDLITKILLSGAAIFVLLMVIINGLHMSKRKDIVNTFAIDSVTITATSKQRTALQENAQFVLDQYKSDTTATVSDISAALGSRVKGFSKDTITSVSELIHEKMKAYQNEFMSWKEYLIVILVALVGALLPLVELFYTYRAIEESKDNEVNQFQVIIAMEYRFNNVTILNILEALENFSIAYKQSLRRCLNNYSVGVKEALETLRYEEYDNRKFCEIVDGLIVASNIGVTAAFAEIDNNRVIGMQAHEVTREIEFERNSNKIDIIALLPMMLVLGGYFIIPFLVSSMGDFLAMYDALSIVQETMR